MIRLQKLSHSDGIDVYEMLKGIQPSEYSFTNPTYSMSYSEFQAWLIQQEQWSNGEMLPDQYVAQTIYWLYDGVIPVGIGKIRHRLTDISRKAGGNIGYAISADYRKKGYGTVFLRLLIEKAKELGIKEILLTVDKGNNPSRCVCENNGGLLVSETIERWYFTF